MFSGQTEPFPSCHQLKKNTNPDEIKESLNPLEETQDSQFIIAARVGDLSVIKSSLEAGINPNQVTPSPLRLAARHGHFDIVMMLADHPETDEKAICSAIKAAERNGNKAIASWLTDQLDINFADKNGNTFLHKAVQFGKIKKVGRLLGKWANPNIKNNAGETPLVIAAYHYAQESTNIIIRILLQFGADPNPDTLCSPLYNAVTRGNLEAVELLLPITKKEDAIITDSDGNETSRVRWYTRLMFNALKTKHGFDILLLLKNYDVNFNEKSETGDSLLLVAIQNMPDIKSISSRLERIKKAYSRSMFPSVETLDERLTRDFRCELELTGQLLNFLLENGVDPVVRDSRGFSPLHYLFRKADFQYYSREYQALFKLFSVDVNHPSNNGTMPIHEAVMNNDIVGFELLVENGAEIDRPTYDTKQTPLHWAAKGGFFTLTKKLLDMGANASAIDSKGHSPLALCSQEISAMLRRKEQYDSLAPFSETRSILESRVYVQSIQLQYQPSPAIQALIRERRVLKNAEHQEKPATSSYSL